MLEWSAKASEWKPPRGWTRVQVVDAHTAGEPLRVVVGGFPELVGDTVLERRRDARENHDALRRALMWEPRGHADMYGCIVMPPVTRDADFSVLFTHNEGFSTMCGHGVIAVTTVAVELGLVAGATSQRSIGIDTPAGFVAATAEVAEGRVVGVEFTNVPSFVLRRGGQVQVDGVGGVTYDLAFGGAFYAYVDASTLGISLVPSKASRIIEVGRAITSAVAAHAPPEHPTEPDLGFLYGTIFTAPAVDGSSALRNVCVFADGELDRSPTGTGVSGLAALMADDGTLPPGRELVVESILGTRFSVRWDERHRVGSLEAVVPRVRGSAHIVGRGELLIDPADPLRHGFLVR